MYLEDPPALLVHCLEKSSQRRQQQARQWQGAVRSGLTLLERRDGLYSRALASSKAPPYHTTAINVTRTQSKRGEGGERVQA